MHIYICIYIYSILQALLKYDVDNPPLRDKIFVLFTGLNSNFLDQQNVRHVTRMAPKARS